MKIHNIKFNKFLIPLILFAISIGGLFLFQALTYTPELSHAESITYEPPELHPNLSDITYMQDITPEICTNTKEADIAGNYQYQLIDKRDSKTYWVARLKDGNCWMTQNLGIINKTISSVDSDMESGSFTIVSSNTSGFTSDTKYQSKAYYDVDYGGYYNWHTATAGSDQVDIVDGNAKSSICPKGWKLPTGDVTSGQFYILLNDITIKQALDNPYNFTFGGYISNTGFGSRDIQSYYWSSTVYSPNQSHARSIYLYTDRNAISFSSWYRSTGMLVRCIALSEVKNYDNVEITVSPMISLDVVDEVVVEKDENNSSVANLDVKVSSNQRYSVGISAANPNLTSTTSSVTIPAKSGLLNTAENGWGIKLKDNTNYTALTTSLQTFYTASGAEIKTTTFTIGISTAPDIPNGEYSTDITITATQN